MGLYVYVPAIYLGPLSILAHYLFRFSVYRPTIYLGPLCTAFRPSVYWLTIFLIPMTIVPLSILANVYWPLNLYFLRSFITYMEYLAAMICIPSQYNKALKGLAFLCYCIGVSCSGKRASHPGGPTYKGCLGFACIRSFQCLRFYLYTIQYKLVPEHSVYKPAVYLVHCLLILCRERCQIRNWVNVHEEYSTQAASDLCHLWTIIYILV